MSRNNSVGTTTPSFPAPKKDFDRDYAPLLTSWEITHERDPKIFNGECSYADDLEDAMKQLHFIQRRPSALYTALLYEWMRCLVQNEHYSNYCRARRTGDQVTIDTLNKKFDAIEEIYEDLGDLRDIGDLEYMDGHVFPTTSEGHVIPPIPEGSSTFEAWLKPRKHLFFKGEKVLSVDEHTKVSDRETLASIPKGLDKKAFEKLIMAFYETNYAPEHGSYEPKYTLNCRISIEMLFKFRRSHFAYYQIKEDGESKAVVVRRMMLIPLLRNTLGLSQDWKKAAGDLGGFILSSKRNQNVKKVNLTDPAIMTRKPNIGKLVQDYQLYIDSALQKSFPA